MNRFRRTREILDNKYATVRDCVQYKRPFVIINFVTEEIFKDYLLELDRFGRLNYILQETHHGGKKYPSVFVTNEGTNVPTEELKEIVKHTMKSHHIDSVLGLHNGRIGVYYRNGSSHTIGREIYSSSDPNEFNSDFFKVDGTCYTFI